MADEVDGGLLRRTADLVNEACAPLGQGHFRLTVSTYEDGSCFWDVIFRKTTCKFDDAVAAARRLHDALGLRSAFSPDDVDDCEDGVYTYCFSFPEDDDDYGVEVPERAPDPPEMTLEQLLAVKSKSTNDTAYLVFAYEFFDAIFWGEKTVEYRYLSEYYAKKLISHPIKYLKCNRGYGHKGEEPMQMVVEVTDIRLANGEQDEIGLHDAVPDGFTPELFAIHLGKVVSSTGTPPRPVANDDDAPGHGDTAASEGEDEAQESDFGWSYYDEPKENYEGMPYNLGPIASLFSEILARRGVKASAEVYMEDDSGLTVMVHNQLEDLQPVYEALQEFIATLGGEFDEVRSLEYRTWQQVGEFWFAISKKNIRRFLGS